MPHPRCNPEGGNAASGRTRLACRRSQLHPGLGGSAQAGRADRPDQRRIWFYNGAAIESCQRPHGDHYPALRSQESCHRPTLVSGAAAAPFPPGLSRQLVSAAARGRLAELATPRISLALPTLLTLLMTPHAGIVLLPNTDGCRRQRDRRDRAPFR